MVWKIYGLGKKSFAFAFHKIKRNFSAISSQKGFQKLPNKNYSLTPPSHALVIRERSLFCHLLNPKIISKLKLKLVTYGGLAIDNLK